MREFDLLKHVFQANERLPARVTIPPGDDMGGVQLDGRNLLVTVDQLIEGVHFQFPTASIEQVARKLVVRNLSDVAAMAAVPVGAVATATLNRRLNESSVLSLFDNIRIISDQYCCHLIGGDVSVWDGPLHLTMTVFAEPPQSGAVLRSGAEAGDSVFITGEIGGAWDQQGGGPHLSAEPRLAVAQELVRLGIHAMIDLSDGLAGDLKHICDLSKVDAEISTGLLPMRRTIAGDGIPAWEHAVSDGEDYELCFTTDSNMPKELAGVKITRVGRIAERRKTGASEIRWMDAEGRLLNLRKGGWEHGS